MFRISKEKTIRLTGLPAMAAQTCFFQYILSPGKKVLHIFSYKCQEETCSNETVAEDSKYFNSIKFKMFSLPNSVKIKNSLNISKFKFKILFHSGTT